MGHLGSLSFFSREYKKIHMTKSFRKGEKWTGWKPTTEEQLLLFKMEVMKNERDMEEDLSTAQKNI